MFELVNKNQSIIILDYNYIDNYTNTKLLKELGFTNIKAFYNKNDCLDFIKNTKPQDESIIFISFFAQEYYDNSFQDFIKKIKCLIHPDNMVYLLSYFSLNELKSLEAVKINLVCKPLDSKKIEKLIKKSKKKTVLM